jgi:HEAT repeat protein
VPALTAWAPVRLAVLPAAAVEPEPEPSAVDSRTSAVGRRPSAVEERGDVRALAAPVVAPASLLDRVRDASPIALLLSIWALVGLAILVSIVHAWLAVRRIVRRGEQLASRDWLDPLYEVADRLGLDEAPRLLRSADAKMPFACGIAAPTIVLPADCDAWSVERRRAVLLHELAHVRRHDLAGHTLGRLVCAVYWFHPLVWTAAQRLRSESERACDDLALVCGARAADYAEHLLDIVTSVRRDTTPHVALAVAGTRVTSDDPASIDRSEGEREPDRATYPDTHGHAGATFDASAAARTSIGAVAGAAVDAALEGVVSPTVQTVISGLLQGESAPLQGRAKSERAELLAKILRADTSASLRRVAAWGLAEFTDEAVASEALANALRRDASARVREMAAWSLGEGETSHQAGLDALAAALRGDAEVEVRQTAAWSLGNIEKSSSIDALVAALADRDAGVRHRAAWAIGNIEPRTAPRQLVALLGDRDPKMREVVAWALYNIEDETAVPALQSALRTEQDKELQIAYIRALASLGDKSVDALRSLLESSDQRVRSMAVRALAGGDAAGPWPWPWPEPRPYP